MIHTSGARSPTTTSASCPSRGSVSVHTRPWPVWRGSSYIRAATPILRSCRDAGTWPRCLVTYVLRCSECGPTPPQDPCKAIERLPVFPSETLPGTEQSGGRALAQAAALRYQHAVEDRDAVIAEALSGLAESDHAASRSDLPAGYSREGRERRISRQFRHNLLGCTSEESGRPGSNRHDQLGRLRFYH